MNDLLYSLEMEHTHTNVCWFMNCCKREPMYCYRNGGFMKKGQIFSGDVVAEHGKDERKRIGGNNLRMLENLHPDWLSGSKDD